MDSLLINKRLCVSVKDPLSFETPFQTIMSYNAESNNRQICFMKTYEKFGMTHIIKHPTGGGRFLSF